MSAFDYAHDCDVFITPETTNVCATSGFGDDRATGDMTLAECVRLLGCALTEARMDEDDTR